MRTIRTLFFPLLIAAVCLGWAPSVAAATADSLPDTTGILTPWRLEPPTPCFADSVFMIVRGFLPTPCDSFLGAEAITPLFVRIRRLEYVDRSCPAQPAAFRPVPVALGRFAAGPHVGVVELVTIQMRSDGSSTTLEQAFRFDFLVGALCEIPPPGPPPPPYLNSIGTEPPRPCAGRPTSLVLKGEFPDGCGQVIDSYVLDSHNVVLTLKPDVLPDTACTLALQPWRRALDLGPLPSGLHRTNIMVHVIRRDLTGTGFVRETYYASHEFFVYGDCDSIPGLHPASLPYVEGILVGRDFICGPTPPCRDDSIQVRVFGSFPDDCHSLRGIELIPPIETVFPPPPPTVRIIVDATGCQRRLCREGPVPWFAAVKLPPMFPSDYRLKVELARVSCSNTYPPGELFRTTVPFTVADTCLVSPPCMMVDFAPGPGNTECNATVSKLHAAELTFLVRPTVALAGLEGEFKLSPSVLQITGIEPIGHAEGMLIDWTPTSEGARFVLFAQSGAPIPPYPPIETVGGGWPVLRVTAGLPIRGTAEAPGRTVVTAENLLGSDIDGQAVRLCPPPPCVDLDPRLMAPHAIICVEQVCDYNIDGLLDVRDLVLMVHCLNSRNTCAIDFLARLDCDGDGSFALADVMCCASHLLQRAPCPDCPPDTVRPAPGVAVRFEAPVETESGVELPVRIAGVEQVGGAMLTLEAPLDRYDVVGFGVSPAGNWLALHEVRDGRIVLGLLDLRGAVAPSALDDARFTLTLALRPGRPAGGEVAAVAGEFSGRDGVALDVELGRPLQTLPGAGEVSLSRNQPNPFSTETAFTLQLNEAADVVVAIYDLRGRAVANVHRAPLTPGPHVFKWDGRDSDGRSAPNGIYFYQATVGGKSLARKLILMRGN